MPPSFELIDFGSFFQEVAHGVKERSDDSDLNILDFVDKEIDKDKWFIELNRRQRLVLKLFYNLFDKVDDLDMEILEAWWSTGKTTFDINHPEAFSKESIQFQALIMEAGRRASKSTLGSLIAAFEYYKLTRLSSPQGHYGIAGSTPISIFVIATAATQSKRTIFKQATGVIRCVPYLQRLESTKRLFIGEEEVRFDEKMVYLYSGNSQSSSQVGQSVILLILDEVARFKDKDGNSNALELWSNLGISGVTFGTDARRVAISSAWYEGDAIQTLYKAAETEPSMLGFSLCSWDLNPEHAARDNPVVSAEYAVDPVQAALEFENKRTSRTHNFFNKEECNRCWRGRTSIYYEVAPAQADKLVRLNLTKIIPKARKPNSRVFMHLDPAVISDSFGLAFGHDEFNEESGIQYIHIDGLLAWDPDPLEGLEVSVSNVQDIVYWIHSHIPIDQVSSDHYASAETLQRLKGYGMRTKSVYFSNPLQLAAYKATRDCLHEDRLILPSNSPLKARVIAEMLDIRLVNNGRKIDHGPDGSKDILDCIAAVVYQLTELPKLEAESPILMTEADFYPEYVNASPVRQSPSQSLVYDSRLVAFNNASNVMTAEDFYEADTKSVIRRSRGGAHSQTSKIKGKFNDL